MRIRMFMAIILGVCLLATGCTAVPAQVEETPQPQAEAPAEADPEEPETETPAPEAAPPEGTQPAAQDSYRAMPFGALDGDTAYWCTGYGIIACKAGRTTYVLSKRALGAKSSAIFSAIIVLSSINWTAVNADTFANLLSTTFSWWPIPVAISAIIVVALWAISAVRGMKGMAIISWLGTPAAVLLTVICCVAISRATGRIFCSSCTRLNRSRAAKSNTHRPKRDSFTFFRPTVQA